MSVLKYLGDFILDLIYPKFCVGCNTFDTYLCPRCYAQIHFLAMDIPMTLEKKYIDRIIAAATFEAPLTDLIKIMKYNSVMDIAKTCAFILYYSVAIPKTDFITAIPLHQKRQQERGFNQAEEIAKHLSIYMKIPYYPFLIRNQHTVHQASIHDPTLRSMNVTNVFEVNQKIIRFFKHKNQNLEKCLLIDDVVTTGATLNECAKILKENGIKKVVGLTLAHGN